MNKTISTKFYCLLFVLFVFIGKSNGQIIISGTVYDSSKLFVISDVNVSTTSGNSAVTDSFGVYHIPVSENDSIQFYFREKYTLKFPVNTIKNYNSFDISLRVKVNESYKLLKGVTIFTKSYKMDSIENREKYSKVFGKSRPTISSNYDPGGAAGFDLDGIIGMFQFKKNKQTGAFQKRLMQEEEDRYVDYMFSSKTITRITSLVGDTLENYKKLYRPTYYFVVNSNLAQFYEYILNTSYAFKRENGIK